ncbi:MAG: flagellar hook-length control protein FliK [Lachnospiraceae bacterium]|nr:flagellar hook-length control protein FliK [Clostridium sp.]MDY4822114.1 flagellar hook-length control protein FliK [Lachnospiraceae bacterium]
MRLTDLLQSTIKSSSQQAAAATEATFPKMVKSLVPGTTIQGEIIAKNGNEVQIRIDKDTVLQARLEQDVNVEEGQNIRFQVKNNGTTLTLSPLLTNTAQADNVYKALQMAGLPINESTVAMTDEMMKLGMSIDSRSLQNMFKDVVTHTDASATDVVFLHKMDMPLTESNLRQIQNYTELQHEVVKGMQDVTDALQGLINGTGGADIAAGVDIAAGADVAAGADGVDANTLTQYQILVKELISDTLMGMLPDGAGAAGDVTGGNPAGGISGDVLAAGVSGADLVGEALADAPMSGNAALIKGVLQDAAFSELINSGLFTEEEAAGFLKDASGLLTEKGITLSGNTASEMMKALLDITAGNTQEAESLQKLFSGKVWKNLLESTVKTQWSLTPETLPKEGEVGKVYEKIVKSLHTLNETLLQNGAQNTALQESITNLSENIDFMNQLNQMYTYVQLPLKMQNGEKNGELYVFTNKRSLAEKDGEVSALLHLTMEHLGPLDVYVKMNQGKVSTEFTVEKEETLLFLEKNMSILTDRLQKRGYDISCKMKVKDEVGEPENPVERLLTEKQNGVVSAHAQYAFDVRA